MKLNIMHKAEMRKFRRDDKAAARPIQEDPSMRLIPLATNQFGRRGWLFEALLTELAYHLVDRPSGCHLLEGTFAMSEHSAAFYIKRRWGARLTWAIERAFNIYPALVSFCCSSD